MALLSRQTLKAMAPVVLEGSSKDQTEIHEIPRDLPENEADVYRKLIKLREEEDLRPRPIVVITDVGRDYDDLAAMVVLKEFHRLRLVELRAVVVNLVPADTRTCYAEVVMESLGLGDIPVACGTRGSPEDHKDLDYEFVLEKFEKEYGSAPLVRRDTMEKLRNALKIQKSRQVLQDGQDGHHDENEQDGKDGQKGQELLREVYETAKRKGEKLYLLSLSSLQDLAQFSATYGDLVAEYTAEVVMQGGNAISEGNLVADRNAANNRFNMDAAVKWHSFMQKNALPSRTYTKIAAFAASLNSKFFEDLEATGHPIGVNLRRVQVEQDLAFYKRSCKSDPAERFQPFMDQKWFLANKTNWNELKHPEGELPEGERVIPYLKIVLYDVHAALGVAGVDVEDTVNATRSEDRCIEVEKGNDKVVVHHWISCTDQSTVDLKGLLVALSALMKGSLLAVPTPDKPS